ncbi:MAG: alanine dehydrogenase [Porticoccus sp.]|jgi:alanine dehydrogenase|uniref:alanine dehydrogenase n=1 Tax=Porticoccus sp. TaxID=2024853 RepID=UPI0039E471A0|tara:strand:- start:7352 stop:8467 length:1116 start_codon:yes stop_codon:yes gene_type:complete
MQIGVPKEVKNHEYRVGLTPDSVQELVSAGHQVLVEQNAGAAIDFADEDFRRAGAVIAPSAAEVFARADMIVKIKEPQPDECQMLKTGQLLFTYLHLAADPRQAELLLKSGAIAMAYETVTDDRGRLPLLAPMSEVAGRMAVQAGAHHLEKAQGGRGVLLGGVPGVAPARVLILGGGVVGSNAAGVALGIGADVTIMDRSVERLRELDRMFPASIRCVYATAAAIENYLPEADLVIGAVLLPGASAPRLVTREMVARMKPGAVVVDVAIDQGGCFATSRPTSHQDPIYVVDGVIHYCVANMPGGVARTATQALNNVTLPFVLQLADNPVRALLTNANLRNGLTIHCGRVTHKAVADSLGHDFTDAFEALKK